MIHQIFFDLDPIRPGEKRPLRVDADADVIVEFYCYRDPPGRFVVCGKIILRPGQSQDVVPDALHFPAGTEGRWRLVLRDREDGDERMVEIAVAKDSSEGSSGMKEMGST